LCGFFGLKPTEWVGGVSLAPTFLTTDSVHSRFLSLELLLAIEEFFCKDKSFMETDKKRGLSSTLMQKNTQQDSLCGYPFQFLMLSLFEDPKPCCRYKIPEGKKLSFPFSEIQEKMLNGEKVPGCEGCYQEEELGVTTMRTRSLEEFKQPFAKKISCKVLSWEWGEFVI
jgi:hypothetical protein